MIVQLLDISTAHIKQSTAELLNHLVFLSDKNIIFTKEDYPDLIIYPKGEYGWFIFAASEELHKSVPEELVKVIEHTKAKGCDWLVLDRDGEIIDELESFDW